MKTSNHHRASIGIVALAIGVFALPAFAFQRFAEIGAIYSPTDALDFALGVIRGRNSASPRVTTSSATVGVTWRFP